jgi:hypothetical protein
MAHPKPIEFAPARKLFLAKSWPVGFDPLVYFTTAIAAQARALALLPTSASQVTIDIANGAYADIFTGANALVSNVNWIGESTNGVVFSGAISWLGGQGNNLSQAAVVEVVSFANIQFTGASMTFDSTEKTGNSQSQIYFTRCTVGARTFTGRANNAMAQDNVFYEDTVDSATGSVHHDWNGGAVKSGVIYWGGRRRGGTYSGNTNVRFDAGENVIDGNPHTYSGTAIGVYQGYNLDEPVHVGTGCNIAASGCKITATVTVTGPSANADLRAANITSQALLVSVTGGTFDRTLTTVLAQVTGAGPSSNQVVFAAPYPNGTGMVITSSQTAGGAATPVIISAQSATGFTFDDAVGGNTYNFAVQKP